MNDHLEKEQEQVYFDKIYKRLQSLRDNADFAMKEVLQLGKGGTFQSKVERDVIVRTNLARLEQLNVGNHPVCFGRIGKISQTAQQDIANSNNKNSNTELSKVCNKNYDSYYIGRLGISDENQEPLVIDWRAPVAEPFYRATGCCPMGIIRRRHFSVVDKKIIGIEDELLLAADDERVQNMSLSGQGALFAALGKARSGKMHDIIATIQSEQDKAIRSPLSGVMIVQGGPGTGKTAVALHRAAYLLYTHRFPLERQGVLVIGPNPVFLQYISHVLPSLGESGITLSSLTRLLEGIEAKKDESRKLSQIKGSLAMKDVIKNAISDRQRPLRKDITVIYGSHRLVFSSQDSKLIINTLKRRFNVLHNAKRKQAQRLVANNLYDEYIKSIERAKSYGKLIQNITNFEDFFESMQKNDIFKEILNRIWPKLSGVELLHDLFGAKPLLESASKGLLSEKEQQLLYRPRSKSIQDIQITNADIPLIDEANYLLGSLSKESNLGKNKNIDDFKQTKKHGNLQKFGHIVVDEAQDLSPMQIRMLIRRSLNGSMTIVGDIAQSTEPHGLHSWDTFASYLPKTWSVRKEELVTGYRTPSEIMEFASHALDATKLQLKIPQSVRSCGYDVEVLKINNIFDTIVSKISSLKEEKPDAMFGVLAPDFLIAEIVEHLNTSGFDIDPKNPKNLNKQISVFCVSQAKGLEFDNVFLVEPSKMLSLFDNEDESFCAKLLYIACTRATNRLVVLYKEKLPQFIYGDKIVKPSCM